MLATPRYPRQQMPSSFQLRIIKTRLYVFMAGIYQSQMTIKVRPGLQGSFCYLDFFLEIGLAITYVNVIIGPASRGGNATDTVYARVTFSGLINNGRGRRGRLGVRGMGWVYKEVLIRQQEQVRLTNWWVVKVNNSLRTQQLAPGIVAFWLHCDQANNMFSRLPFLSKQVDDSKSVEMLRRRCVFLETRACALKAKRSACRFEQVIGLTDRKPEKRGFSKRVAVKLGCKQVKSRHHATYRCGGRYTSSSSS